MITEFCECRGHQNICNKCGLPKLTHPDFLLHLLDILERRRGETGDDFYTMAITVIEELRE